MPRDVFLIPIAGPSTIGPLALKTDGDGPSELTLGRHESCDLKLPITAETVSRYHARFRFDGNRWRLHDCGSRWGTFLNGVQLVANHETPLGDGDLIRINPWTFTVGAAPQRRGLLTANDTGQTMVRMLSSGAGPQSDDLLPLLLEAAGAIHDARNETELAQRLIDSAVRGSGLPNAAVLRPTDTAGHVEILASRLPTSADGARFTFSRSLLAAAADGYAAEITGVGDVSQSIVQMNISAAICVPLMLGPAPAAFLYLDARSRGGNLPALSPIRPNAAAFCAALGRLAGLALANLKRLDVERRQAAIEGELSAASAAQKWVLPQRLTIIGKFTVIGECHPGRYVGGDFFDVVDLGDDKIAIALGDVSGKGVEASVLMTASQGFLHAALSHYRDPGKAVTELNRFVAPRRPESRFVTLWAAVVDLKSSKLSYVDAGHGYAALLGSDGQCTNLNINGGPPLGVSESYEYVAETLDLPPSGRIIVVSDGVVEQPAAGSTNTAERNEFKMNGLHESLRKSPCADDIASVFQALVAHAGTDQLADDATAVCVRW